MPALRACATENSPTVLEFRRAATMLERAQEHQACLFAWEVCSGETDSLIESLALANQPFAWHVLLGDALCSPAGWAVRELGVLHGVASPRQVSVVYSIAARLFAGFPLHSPGIAERIWQELPWKEAAVRTVPPPAEGM